MTLVFIGDPHGEYASINKHLADHRAPGTAVLVGDLDLERPLRETMAPSIAAGWSLRWILGNHDVDKELYYKNLVDDFPGGEIAGSRFLDVRGLRVTGLGGVVREKVWNGADAPTHESPEDMIRALGRHHRWRGGLPLRQRCSIFRSAVEVLSRQRADVLVCHEAPSTHKHGWPFIDDLADRMGVRWIVHGHHHKSYESDLVLPSGRTCRVRGLAKCEVWEMAA